MSELTNEQILLIGRRYFKDGADTTDVTLSAYCDSVREIIASYGLVEPSKSPLSDADIDTIAESMPGGMDGFLKGWGWRNFARAVEAEVLLFAPVIPEGFQLVPIEPTEDMVVSGFESWPDRHFSKPEDWAAFEAMTGCQQAAHKARLCYAAMIEAAPIGDKA